MLVFRGAFFLLVTPAGNFLCAFVITSLKIDILPKQGPVQKEHSLPTSIFHGDMLVFVWGVYNFNDIGSEWIFLWPFPFDLGYVQDIGGVHPGLLKPAS